MKQIIQFFLEGESPTLDAKCLLTGQNLEISSDLLFRSLASFG